MSKRPRKALAAARGYRPVTAAEKRALGLAQTVRKYVRADLAQVTADTKLFERRAIEQPIIGQTFEKSAARRAKATRGASRLTRGLLGQQREAYFPSRYAWHLHTFAQANGLTIGQARTSAQRKADYQTILRARAAVRGGDPSVLDAGGAYAKALERLGLRDPSWTWAVGDTPTFRGGAQTHYDDVA